MLLPPEERSAILALKAAGNTVFTRLEETGLEFLTQLAQANTQEILALDADSTRSNCWKSSQQARAAIDAVIQLAPSQK
ncbi:MAG: hypothetical protein PHD12_05795 [Methylotenera sp.]|nr:hypothetical protein [Methylotenera sp.]